MNDASRDRRAPGIALGVALLIALIRGFRAPNLWSATLQSASLTDGFHRRFLVGTLLRPVVAVVGYRYAVFACFSYAVLIALLWIVIRAALRTPLWSRRAVVLAWLLLPTGGFVFNEVGYFDQVLYLLLFASLALVQRGRLVAAACVMALTPMVHEIALLTVVPIFGWFALREVAPRRAVLATAPAAVIAGLLLIIAPITPTAIDTLVTALRHADFAFRVDALALFERTQAQSQALYSVRAHWAAMQAPTVFAVLGFVSLWFADGALWRPAPRLVRAGMLAVSCLAIAAPALLVLGGWDDNRWVFMLISNGLLVVWHALGERRDELAARAACVGLVVLLLLAQCPLYYFDRLTPRPLVYRGVRHFLVELVTGHELEIPDL